MKYPMVGKAQQAVNTKEGQCDPEDRGHTHSWRGQTMQVLVKDTGLNHKQNWNLI